MAKKDLRIDAYIAKSAEFAKPILKHLRETRKQRLKTSIERMTEQTLRNWKYLPKKS